MEISILIFLQNLIFENHIPPEFFLFGLLLDVYLSIIYFGLIEGLYRRD